MLVGICTHYHRCENTHIACRIAGAASHYGGDAVFYTDQDRHPPIDPAYDAHVTLSSRQPFKDWARACTHVIWTSVPLLSDLQWAADQGKHTVIVPNWHELRSAHRKVLHAAGTVICTNRTASDMLIRKWKLSRCIPAGWDPGLPIVRKRGPHDPTRPRLFYPLEMITPHNQPSILFMLRRLLNDTSATLSVAYTPSRIDSQTRRHLEGLEDRFGERVKLLQRLSLHAMAAQFAVHDLTLWPSRMDNAAVGALMSAYSGTPVLAFNTSPINEFLHASTLVPCNYRHGPLGNASAVVNYPDYNATLGHLLERPDALQQTYVDTTHLLGERSRNFERAWRLVFEN